MSKRFVDIEGMADCRKHKEKQEGALAQNFSVLPENRMKPQQQNTDVKGHSHVYVQTPDGKEINVPAESAQQQGNPKDSEQSAENTPTTHSGEVTSGEDA